MKHLIFGSIFFLFCAKSYAQKATHKDTNAVWSQMISLNVKKCDFILDRRLIGCREVDYIIVNGVWITEGFSVDKQSGKLFYPFEANSKTLIIFKP